MLSEEESNNGPHRLIEDEEQKRNTSSSPEGQTELGLFFGEVGTLEEQAQGTRQKSESLKTGPDEKSNDQGDSLIGHSGKDLVNNESSLVGNGFEKSKDEGHLLISNSSKDLAKKISKNENIPFGTAKNYITEIRKELKTKEPKSSKREEKSIKKAEKKTPKQILQAKVKEFQKKYGKMSYDQKEAALERLLNSLRKVRKQQADLHKKTMELGSKDSELVELISAVGQEKRIWKLKV